MANLPPETAAEFLIDMAANAGASDIYLVAGPDSFTASMRRFGILNTIAELPAQVGHRVASIVCAETGMRTGDRKQPQDGHWVIELQDGRRFALRVHNLPTLFGDSLAIRLLNPGSELSNLDRLGMLPQQLQQVSEMLHRPGGLILFAGPSACGKTTTAYASINRLNDGTRTIHTLEDPVEYAMPGVRQTQYELSGGADVAELLRGVLRQGPDALLIGEVRNRVTAEGAVDAASGGRLVLATVNSPFVSTAITRLIHLGASPYFLASTLIGVVGQRLLRTLNPEKRVQMDLSAAPRTFEEVRSMLGPEEGNVVYAAQPGLEHPEDAYSGMTGVFETLPVTDQLRDLISESNSAGELARHAVENGMIDFRRAAMVQVAKGNTSFDEMQRIVPLDEVPHASN